MEVHSNIKNTYGAMFIGVLFATFFHGLLTVQAYIYYESFPRDPTRIKVLVGIVWIIDFVHLVLISQTTFHYLVTSWGDPMAFIYTTPELNLHVVIIGMVTIICQGFFLHRVWIISHHQVLLVLPLAMGCLAATGINIAVTIEIMEVPLLARYALTTTQAVAMFAIGAASDVLIAGVLCFYLHRGKSGFSRSDSLVSRLMQYVVATGFATRRELMALLATACLLALIIAPTSFFFMGMHFSLGRFYTNALLASLNARRSWRQDGSKAMTWNVEASGENIPKNMSTSSRHSTKLENTFMTHLKTPATTAITSTGSFDEQNRDDFKMKTVDSSEAA